MRTIATVGVYDSSLDDFLAKLKRHHVALLVDVRQRRGVRGREYAWANSLRLQASLKQSGIEYRHLPELAPTTELRQLQYREDDRLKVGKRSRIQLSDEYRRRYINEVLDRVDLGSVLESLPDNATSALMCVERDAPACHRSLIAARLHARFGVPILNL
ncbi:MAG: DUF488 domain-containing protein [Chloroflexota bacterium]|nr:MAG: DUF488 domain-containing protein [Chloroflexota bacterium]TMD85866.1 MAG: DUF488 domain-containing protein [Chloroflexota bacterium]